jgi:two-component system, OmpR family, alkaline phosphatase synthesis response regulator PhoP
MSDQKRVLVIDDDPDFLSFVQIILVANGYAVATASTANEGLEAMRRDPPDLVIADVMISYVLDGWMVTREMRSDPRLREIPLMMVSAIVSDKDDSLFPSLEDSRVDAFMSKPLAPSALLRRVAELTGSKEDQKS